ncbi:MAG: hypothetical protein PF485_13225 [Bacteroidales bacterium]|jgi:uncharacterized protein with PQ loop repeat|nr:hypothetical protein [Bacteroidales bacterium]
MAGIHFKESQKAKMARLWIIFICLYGLIFWAFFAILNDEIDVTAISSMVFSLSLIILFNVVVIVMRLDVDIDEVKITYRYKPFHVKPRIIYWDDVSDFYVRNYKPMREYGGHGLQRKMKYGRAFTVSGKNGLQLILKDGKKILFGTQKPQELERIIGKMKSRTD